MHTCQAFQCQFWPGLVNGVCQWMYQGSNLLSLHLILNLQSSNSVVAGMQVIHRLPMPHKGDELHHSGWNA